MDNFQDNAIMMQNNNYSSTTTPLTPLGSHFFESFYLFIIMGSCFLMIVFGVLLCKRQNCNAMDINRSAATSSTTPTTSLVSNTNEEQQQQQHQHENVL